MIENMKESVHTFSLMDGKYSWGFNFAFTLDFGLRTLHSRPLFIQETSDLLQTETITRKQREISLV